MNNWKLENWEIIEILWQPKQLKNKQKVKNCETSALYISAK